MRPVQYFTDEYLQQCQKMKPLQILKFLEDFRQLQSTHFSATKPTSTLISLRVPNSLLTLLKARAKLEGLPYQTLLKRILQDSL